MMALIFRRLVHLETAVAVEEDDQTQVNRKEQTDRHCYTKVNDDSIVKHVKVCTKEVKSRPVSKEFIHEKQGIKSEKVCRFRNTLR